MGKSLVSCFFLTHGVCGAGSMHLSGVRPSVCLSQRGQQQQTAAVARRQEILIDCCTVHSSAAFGGQMQVVSVRTS